MFCIKNQGILTLWWLTMTRPLNRKYPFTKLYLVWPYAKDPGPAICQTVLRLLTYFKAFVNPQGYSALHFVRNFHFPRACFNFSKNNFGRRESRRVSSISFCLDMFWTFKYISCERIEVFTCETLTYLSQML